MMFPIIDFETYLKISGPGILFQLGTLLVFRHLPTDLEQNREQLREATSKDASGPCIPPPEVVRLLAYNVECRIALAWSAMMSAALFTVYYAIVKDIAFLSSALWYEITVALCSYIAALLPPALCGYAGFSYWRFRMELAKELAKSNRK